MERMRAIVLSACAVSLLAGALDAIRPSPKFDRQMKLLLSAVFLLAILTPLVQGSRDFSVDWSGDEVFSAELTETVAQETAACAAENLEEAQTSVRGNYIFYVVSSKASEYRAAFDQSL